MLTLVGAAALTCMVVCYALEARSPWFVFAFGLACLWASAYEVRALSAFSTTTETDLVSLV